jgi:ribonuclease H2 subunit B
MSQEDDILSGEEQDDLNASFELDLGTPIKISKQNYKDLVFLIKGDPKDITITQLPHPRTGQLARYVISGDKQQVLEVQKIYAKPSSYFIDDNVKEDGALYSATPTDPLFLLLPRLEKLRNKTKSDKAPNGSYTPMHELYMDLEQPNYSHLKDVKGADLELLCDVEDMGDDKYVRLNDEKVVLWLRAKLNQIADLFELSTKATQLGLSLVRAQVEGYMASKHDTLSHDQVLHIAAGLLGDYIALPWLVKLKSCYNAFDTKAAFLVPASPATPGGGGSRKRKSMFDDLDEDEDGDNKTPTKKRRTSLAQSQLAKTDTSKMKKLTSFFTSPKPK